MVSERTARSGFCQKHIYVSRAGVTDLSSATPPFLPPSPWLTGLTLPIPPPGQTTTKSQPASILVRNINFNQQMLVAS